MMCFYLFKAVVGGLGRDLLTAHKQSAGLTRHDDVLNLMPEDPAGRVLSADHRLGWQQLHRPLAYTKIKDGTSHTKVTTYGA